MRNKFIYISCHGLDLIEVGKKGTFKYDYYVNELSLLSTVCTDVAKTLLLKNIYKKIDILIIDLKKFDDVQDFLNIKENDKYYHTTHKNSVLKIPNNSNNSFLIGLLRLKEIIVFALANNASIDVAFYDSHAEYNVTKTSK
jgi:hypothetical protein